MKPNNKKKSEKKKTHQVQFYPSVHAIGKARAEYLGLSFPRVCVLSNSRRCRGVYTAMSELTEKLKQSKKQRFKEASTH